MNSIVQDLRYGLRSLRNQPTFTALAVFTLALGIGAATTIFSVIQNVLLDPFPYVDAAHIVMPQIRDANRSDSGGRAWFKPQEFLEYQSHTEVFAEVIASGNSDVLYTTKEGTERFIGVPCSGNMFQFLGVPPLVGRTLTPADTIPGAPPAFVMGYKMWLTRFNLDRAIIGQTFVLNGVPTTLVGIMPPRFTKGDGDAFIAVVIDPADEKIRNRYFRFQARLQPGVTMQQAEAAITLVAQRQAKLHPEDYPAKFTVKIVSWLDNIVRGFRQTLYILAAAVALLLLIACANVANLLLARAATREKEMAVRIALGASRAQIIRQCLLESLLLALLGMAFGCLFAHFGIQLLVAMMPDHAIPAETVIHLNVSVLLCSLGITALTALTCGIVPALQTIRPDVVEALKDSSKGGGGGFRGGKFRSALVVAEVALSLVLLSGAGLLMRSFTKTLSQNLGLETEHVLYTPLTLPPGQYDSAAAKQKLFRALLPRLQALPGVIAVTAGTRTPPLWSLESAIEISGQVGTETWKSRYDLCSEGYFQTLGLRLLQGRLLTSTEIEMSRRSIVVNQTLVNRYFATENPLGRKIKFKSFVVAGAPEGDATFEIVGVIADFKNDGVQEPVSPEAFMPYTTTGSTDRALMVRATGNPLGLLNDIRHEIWAQDRSVALTDSDSIPNYLTKYAYGAPRFTLIVLGIFAGVGLVLVALGVYSVIAYVVSRQTHEFGLRMALGASPADVLGLVMRKGMGLVGLGLAVGMLASLAVTRVLASELWGVSPQDPATFSAALGVVAIAGLAACYFPARRATRVDPMVALRHG